MEQEGKNILDYVDIFYRRKWVIAIPAVLLTVAAVAAAFMMPSYYKSSTLIIIEGQQVPEAYVQATDRTPLSSRLSTLSQQIMSRTRLEKIAEEFNLYDNGEGSDLSRKETVIEQMRNDIEVQVISGGTERRRGGRDADAFSVSYVSRDPQVAMKVTNTLASLFIEENLKIREQYAEGTSEFLVNELDKAKADLEAQERALRDFKERHMGSLPEQLDANLRTLDRLQLDLQTVAASIRNTTDRIHFLEEQLGVGPAGSSSSISAQEVELTRLRAELATLKTIYKDNYPDVIMLTNRIEEVESRIAEERRQEPSGEPAPLDPQAGALANPTVFSDLSSSRSTLESLSNREADIRRQIQRYERRVEETPANEQRLADIQRDYEISLENYKSLLEKKLNARLAENLEKRQKGERFRVVDPANLPVLPFKPDRPKVIGMGGAAGLGLGVLLALVLEFLNPAFRRPEEIAKALPYPVLTTIPIFTPRTNGEPAARFSVVKGKKGRKQA